MVFVRRLLTAAELIAVTLLLSLNPGVSFAAELRYQFKPGQKFAFEVEIVGEVPGSVETHKGVAVYRVQSVTDGNVQLIYNGGLKKSVRSDSAGSGRRRGFGPGGPGGPFGPGMAGFRPGGPFGGNPLRGLVQAENHITLASNGDVVSLEDSSQLPYLLGNLSLLFFEPLPDAGQQSWVAENGVTVRQGGRDSDFPFPRTPFDEPERQTAAKERSEYQAGAIKGDLTSISRKYVFSMPSSGPEDPAIEVTGEGNWDFDTEIGLPASMDFKQKMVLKTKNSTLEIPVTVKYQRIPEDKLDAFLAEREKKAAADMQELQDRIANKPKPIPAEEKKKILEDLSSTEFSRLTGQLVKLKIMNPHPDDKDIALAIQPHLQATNRPTRVMAEAAWSRWKVLVEGPATAAADSNAESKTGSKSEMKAAAAESENPFELPSDLNVMRKWTDATGKFTIDAEFVSLKDGNVTLKRKDGKEVTMALDRLSKDDQALAKKIAGEK